MTTHFVREAILERAVVRNLPDTRHQVDRSFELPRALYAATVALYLGFIAVMAVGFASPHMAMPVAIFVIFVLGGFGVPAIWTRLAPTNESKPLTLGQFRHRGIHTLTGRLSARDAAIQMLILPVLILLWGLTMAVVATLA